MTKTPTTPAGVFAHTPWPVFMATDHSPVSTPTPHPTFKGVPRMATRRQRPCLVCGRLTRNASRCDPHQAAWQALQDQKRGSAHQRGYDSAWRRTSKAAVAQHRAAHGDWCPGWRVPAHPATDLTGDHIVPKAAGGTDEPSNVQVMCRRCNSRKHNQSA